MLFVQISYTGFLVQIVYPSLDTRTSFPNTYISAIWLQIDLSVHTKVQFTCTDTLHEQSTKEFSVGINLGRKYLNECTHFASEYGFKSECRFGFDDNMSQHMKIALHK